MSGGSEVLITRACDMCRKKKIRCEPTEDVCVQCKRYQTECHFTPIKVKRRPRRANGQPRVDELEKRLKKMEERIKLTAERHAQSSTEGESPPELMEIMRHESPSREQHNTFQWSPYRALGQEKPYRNTDFLRPSDGARTPNLVILSLTDGFAGLQDNYTEGDWNLTAQHSLFSRRIFKPMPPRDEAIRLIHKFFAGFNSVFPIFGQSSYLQMIEYSQDFTSPTYWACINVVLALGHRFDALRSTNNIAEDRKAWGYFQNALSVSTELSMLHPTLASVQALLGMAIIVQGTPNPTPFSSLLSSAIKVAHRMNLHRKIQPGTNGLSPSEIQTRKQVFWVAYFLDKDLSLRIGQPPNQDDEEMDLDLDSPFHVQVRMQRTGSRNSNSFFLARIQLAKIQGQVYKRLMSIRASRQSVHERISAVRDLIFQLKRWRSTVPIDFDAEYFTPTLDVPDVAPTMHHVTLRLSYFKTLSVVHQFAVVERDQTTNASSGGVGSEEDVLEPPPPITCVDEARKALKLLHATPREDYGCIWVVLHIFVSATTTLLSNILSLATKTPETALDLALIDPLLRLLGALAKQGKSEEVADMYIRCNDLWQQVEALKWKDETVSENQAYEDMHASAPVEHNEESAMTRNQKESVEDFIKRIEMISQGIDVREEEIFSTTDIFSWG